MTKWIENWKRNNWMKAGGKESVKNKEDFKILYALCQECSVIWVCTIISIVFAIPIETSDVHITSESYYAIISLTNQPIFWALLM